MKLNLYRYLKDFQENAKFLNFYKMQLIINLLEPKFLVKNCNAPVDLLHRNIIDIHYYEVIFNRFPENKCEKKN